MTPGRQQPTGRLAPSPTGGLHVGHARTFLIAWLAARSGGGRVILRVEDIDASRVRPGAAEEAMADLRWLGLNWDEGPDLGGPSSPYIQSARSELYDAALARLKQAELVYPCTCTRSDIERAASAPHAGDEGPRYPGTCSFRSAQDAERLGGRPFAWRFRVPKQTVAWRDAFKGDLALDPERIGGDFVVGRSTGAPAYQLAVVCDDAAMGIDQVIRGDDLIPSTPRQILLHRALGFQPPGFGHVPLAFGPDGRRLAKRDGSIKLSLFREAGRDPKRLVGLLARSCGWSQGLERVAPVELLERNDLGKIPHDPWIVPLHELGTMLP
jgi:glutamyl-tRNA synthetase